MNREQTKEAIKVMQAYVDGEEIEVAYDGAAYWWKYPCPSKGDSMSTRHLVPSSVPSWDWSRNRYRIAPKKWWAAISPAMCVGPSMRALRFEAEADARLLEDLGYPSVEIIEVVENVKG